MYIRGKWTSLLLRFAMALSALGSLGTATSHGEEASVTVAVEGIFPPFNYRDSNNVLQGFDIDIANAICTAAQLKCEFVVQDWDGMIPNLLAGKYDTIISSMSMSAERKERVRFTARYYDSPSVFVVQKASPLKRMQADELLGKKLGVTFSTAQASFADDRYSNIERVVYPSSPDLYKALEAEEVDVILEDKLAIYDWLTNTKAGSCCEFRGDDVKDPKYFGEGAGIAVRPDDAALLQRLDQALAKIQDDGTYDGINAKYFPFSIR
ncbi:transporter substrate-binding domain-containing protein [Neorhizobium sp. BT27B]|uniref:transporter substrate-binding domain-containing protein n=1 Tax=Neorhizobium sp. BT27B TaxID=3142625 RepID=UPI003D2D07A1